MTGKMQAAGRSARDRGSCARPAPGGVLPRTSGCTLAYESAGKGPPLLLLHGMTGSARTWRLCLRLLSRHFTVYAIDFAGFGDSRGERFGLRNATGCIEEFMDTLGLSRASVVGHSMGALVAADLAALRPDRVDRLVLVAPPLIGLRRPLRAHAREMLTGLRAIPLGLLPALAFDLLRAGPGTLWRAARDLLVFEGEAIVASLRTPTLLVWGDRDRLVPLRIGRRLAQLLPGSQLVVIEGASHAPMWDAPRQFVRAVVRYLSDRS